MESLKMIECSEGDYWRALEDLPPSFAAVRLREGGILAFLSGEPWDHVHGIPTFSGYMMLGSQYFVTDRPVTPGEFSIQCARYGLALKRWAWEG